MNDKIRKLYEEAKSFYLTDEYILEPSKEDCELIGEKFAELLIREFAYDCIDSACSANLIHFVANKWGVDL